MVAQQNASCLSISARYCKVCTQARVSAVTFPRRAAAFEVKVEDDIARETEVSARGVALLTIENARPDGSLPRHQCSPPTGTPHTPSREGAGSEVTHLRSRGIIFQGLEVCCQAAVLRGEVAASTEDGKIREARRKGGWGGGRCQYRCPQTDRLA
ncbi:hypothetical protein JOB18_016398 [Solea senegalensis]|uniref:Uncharacterized protein n=1 Tax=Solea senegalensis TaxID=28829 RepID=A0AAV6SII0_SOLSE|nr:hypothetical protein JOB18_016398 [Solea senegalensis]